MMFARVARPALFVAFALTAIPAFSHPVAYYNPATGNIRVNSAGLQPLHSILAISSATGQFTTNASAYAAIPGAIFDSGDLPLGFTYISFPSGHFNIGNIVTPGTPASDLNSPDTITVEGLAPGFTIITVPEPTSIALFIAGALSLTVAARRGKLRSGMMRRVFAKRS